MIKPKCDKCIEELGEFGAIVLSPPDSVNMVRKFHLCVNCYDKLFDEYFSENDISDRELVLTYFSGFNDELNVGIRNTVFKSRLKSGAYNFGRANAILGGPSSIDKLSNEDILKYIKKHFK
jgi:hypothetical protein